MDVAYEYTEQEGRAIVRRKEVVQRPLRLVVAAVRPPLPGARHGLGLEPQRPQRLEVILPERAQDQAFRRDGCALRVGREGRSGERRLHHHLLVESRQTGRHRTS